MNPYDYLSAGWNLLVGIDLSSGIDLDSPQYERKVDYEYT